MSAALTSSELEMLVSAGAVGGDKWLIRNSEPVVAPRLGTQLAGQLGGSDSVASGSKRNGVSWTIPS